MPRFSIRRLMIAVALVAVLLAAGGLAFPRQYYRRIVVLNTAGWSNASTSFRMGDPEQKAAFEALASSLKSRGVPFEVIEDPVVARLSIWSQMLVVAVAGLLLAACLELLAWGPARRSREALIAHHEGLARRYDRELAGPPPVLPMEADLRAALLASSARHKARAAELRGAGRFDPRAERARDGDGATPFDDALLQERLAECRDPRNL